MKWTRKSVGVFLRMGVQGEQGRRRTVNVATKGNTGTHHTVRGKRTFDTHCLIEEFPLTEE